VSAIRRLASPILGTLALLVVAVAPAGAAVELSSKPKLRPAFDRKVTDYVTRCVPGKALRVFVHASDGDRVAVGDRKRYGGHFERKVARKPDAAFAIRVRSGKKTTAYHVRCLPQDFPDWSFQANGKAQAQWYVIEPSGAHSEAGYIAIFDRNGVPVWWRHSSSFAPWDGKLLPDGTLAYTRWYGDHFGVRDKDAYEVRRLDGRLVRLVRAVDNPTDTHDLQQLPNGNFLVIVYRRRCCVDLSSKGGPTKAQVFDGEIQELTPGGKLVWRWNSKNHIPLSWTTGTANTTGWWYQEIQGTPHRPSTENAYDLVHLNSVEPDPASRGAGGDGLIVSARHLDAVFRINRATKEIDWKLGGTRVVGKSLVVPGWPPTQSLFGGQHDARLWKDGSLTVHDNGSWRYRPPVMYRFAIDTITRTATILEHITNPAVDSSQAIGSTRKLPGGNWVTSWGGSPIVTEQDETGAIVRRFAFAGNRWSYRAVPIEPGRLAADTLRRGMDRMIAARRTARR
jgi:hypothetical protein